MSFDSDVLYFKASSQWNHEATVQCIRDMNDLLPRELPKDFAFVVDTLEFEGATEDALVPWVDQLDHLETKGMTHLVRIMDPGSMVYDVFLQKYDAMLVPKVELLRVSAPVEAREALRSMGFQGTIP